MYEKARKTEMKAKMYFYNVHHSCNNAGCCEEITEVKGVQKKTNG